MEALQLRQDKDGLIRLWSSEACSHLNLETAETMAVMTDSVDILTRLQNKLGVSVKAAQEYLRMFGKVTV